MPRNILELFQPVAPDNVLKADDRIHLGRSAGTAFEQDATISGAEFFNTVNAQHAVYGTPSVSGDSLVANVRKNLTGYGAGAGPSGHDEAAGTITIQNTGVYRVIVNMITAVPVTDNYAIGCYMNWASGNILVGGSSVPNAQGQATDSFLNLSGGTIVSLTAGDVLILEVGASVGLSPITFLNGTFEVIPVSL